MAKSLSSLVVGALVKDTGTLYNGKPIIWKIADKNHAGFPANSVTLITERIISLKCFDAMEPSNNDGNRRSYGNNRWIWSNIRRWLNSQAGAGAWYAAQHGQDAPPNNSNVWNNYNEYEAEAGFLAGFCRPADHEPDRRKSAGGRRRNRNMHRQDFLCHVNGSWIVGRRGGRKQTCAIYG